MASASALDRADGVESGAKALRQRRHPRGVAEVVETRARSTRQVQRPRDDAPQLLAAAEVAQIAHIGVRHQQLGLLRFELAQPLHVGVGGRPQRHRRRAVAAFEVGQVAFDRLAAEQLGQHDRPDAGTRRLALQRRLERGVDRPQVVQQRHVGRSFDAAAQQAGHQAGGLDAAVLVAGGGLQPPGQ